MNTLITGGAGFMGSHFVKLLQKEFPYRKIFVVDKLTYAGNKKNLEETNITFYESDICDYESMSTIIKDNKIDIILNAAAETHVDRSIRDPKAFLDADIYGLFNLVYCSIKNKVKKFISISTDEIYGPTEFGIFNENSKFTPTSPYSASKAAGDLLLQSYIKTYNFPAIIVRPCNNYGPNQYPEKLVPATITRLLQGKKALMHGNGNEIREWIYIEDCCRDILNIMENGKIGEAYNIGSDYRIRNIEMIAIIYETMKFLKIKNIPLDYIKKITNRPGNDYRYAIDSSKINKIRNYELTTIVNGLLPTIKWYKDNPNWWDTIDLEANIYKEGRYLR